jgi:hypothetical protein
MISFHAHTNKLNNIGKKKNKKKQGIIVLSASCTCCMPISPRTMEESRTGVDCRSFGLEVGIEEFRKNLIGFLRRFHRTCMHLWWLVYKIPHKFLRQSSMPISATGFCTALSTQSTATYRDRGTHATKRTQNRKCLTSRSRVSEKIWHSGFWY